MQKKDMTKYSTLAHTMSTDSRYFGFTKLADLATIHEEKSKDNDYSYVSTHINDLIAETNNAIIMIQEYMNGTETDSNKKEIDAANIYNSKTILVVDDSNIIRNFVKKIFSDQYNVGTAKDGEEAINIIEANKDNDNIEAILLDLNMPKVDGFAVLEFMRENDLLNKTPVSIISGDSSKETIDRAFTYNIVDMLEKPFNNQSIKTIIEKTVVFKKNN
jgi:CheY-like chemotaxis protein